MIPIDKSTLIFFLIIKIFQNYLWLIQIFLIKNILILIYYNINFFGHENFSLVLISYKILLIFKIYLIISIFIPGLKTFPLYKFDE